MNKITVNEKDINRLLVLDIDELNELVDSSSDNICDNYTNRTNLIERMNIIKEQCDKIINRIDEYDNRSKEVI